MCSGRLKLLPWLRRQIDSGMYSGLRWCNATRTEFRIDWKHGSRQEYSIDQDACVFKAWAEYTGKYRKGIDKPLAKRWKANFRCALNSLPEVTLLPTRSENRGPGAFRVFRIRTSRMHESEDDRLSSDDSLSGCESDSADGSSEYTDSSSPWPKMTKTAALPAITDLEFRDFSDTAWIKSEDYGGSGRFPSCPQSTSRRPLQRSSVCGSLPALANDISSQEFLELVQFVIGADKQHAAPLQPNSSQDQQLPVKAEIPDDFDMSLFQEPQALPVQTKCFEDVEPSYQFMDTIDLTSTDYEDTGLAYLRAFGSTIDSENV